MATKKGSGWHGETKRHKEVAVKDSLKDTLREPMVDPQFVKVYHGTHADIKKFVRYDRVPRDYKGIGSDTFGTYFTDTRKMAEQFGSKVVTTHINPAHLFDLTRIRTFDDLVDALPINRKKHEFKLKQMELNSYYHLFKPTDSFYKPMEDLFKMFKLRAVLRKKGYDGVMFNDSENGIHGKTFVIFDPKDILVESIEPRTGTV